jgi:hypothetical protein
MKAMRYGGDSAGNDHAGRIGKCRQNNNDSRQNAAKICQAYVRANDAQCPRYFPVLRADFDNDQCSGCFPGYK